MKEQDDIVELFISTMNKTATESQKEELDYLLKEEPIYAELLGKFFDENSIKEELKHYANFDTSMEWRKLAELRKKELNRRTIIRIRYIASIAAIAILSFLLYYNFSENNTNVIVGNQSVANLKESIVDPILISQNRIITLTKELNKIKLSDNTTVKNENLQISYQNQSDTSSVEENTIIIPKLRQHSVKLDDGTVVRLNANSEMTFPIKFNKNERVITLKGEAFFDVAKESRPFIVRIETVDIKVYGTSFNVKCDWKNEVRTTLLSGLVSVRLNGGNEMMLQPGEMAIVNTQKDDIKIQLADKEVVTSWINNSFHYVDENLDAVLCDIASWYGLKFNYDKDLFNNIKVTAVYNRDLKHEYILKSLTKILNIKFIKIDETNYDIE